MSPTRKEIDRCKSYPLFSTTSAGLSPNGLELELDEVPAAALFFNDLGGESLDLLELSFRIDKHFGVRVRFNDLTTDAIELDDQGRLTAASLALLKTDFRS